jgi:hypothetical protein
LQLVQLGVVLSVAALAFNTLLGACSGQVGRWLQRRPGAEKFQRGLLALVMVGLAIRLLLLDRPGVPSALSATPVQGRMNTMLNIWGRISSINVRKVVWCAQELGARLPAHRGRRQVRRGADARIPGAQPERDGAHHRRRRRQPSASRSGSRT